MANQHVFKMIIDGDISNLEQTMKKAVNMVKDKYGEMDKAADKVKHLKGVVDYISQIDAGLDALKQKDPLGFEKAFGGLDKNLVGVMEELFGTSSKTLGVIDALREKIGSLSGDEGTTELKKLAQTLNGLFEAIGKVPPLDIDGLFSGKANANKTQDRIDKLNQSLLNFISTWDMANQKILGGFNLSGVGGGIGRSADEIGAQIDDLRNKLKELQSLKANIDKAISDATKFNDGDNIFSHDKKFTPKDISQIYADFVKAGQEFKKFNGDKNSNEYRTILSNYLQQASNFASMYEIIIDVENDNNKIFNDLKNKTFKNGGTFGDALKSANALAMKVLTGEEQLSSQLLDAQNFLDSQIVGTSKHINQLQTELRQVGNASIGRGMSNAGDGVRQVGEYAVNATEYILVMTNALREMFDLLSQPLDTEYKLSIVGKDIDILKGQNGEVDTKTLAQGYLTDIDAGKVVNAHSHMGKGAGMNYFDFQNVMDSYYSGIYKLGATIGKNEIATWNLDNIPIEDAKIALEEIKKLNQQVGDLSVDQINEVFKKINPNYTGVAKSWKPDQFKDLATFIYDIGQQSKIALSPAEQFQNVLKMFVKDIDISKYKDLIDGLTEDNKFDTFNKIMEAEKVTLQDGSLLQVESVQRSSLADVAKEIQEQKDNFAELREQATITYKDIQKAAEEYENSRHKKDKQGLDFFQKYFHVSEIEEIDKLFDDKGAGKMNMSDVVKNIASRFNIEEQFSPDDVIEQSAEQKAEAIKYAKKILVKAYQDYYQATDKAIKDGVEVDKGFTSEEMDNIYDSISEMIEKWNLSTAKQGNLSASSELIDIGASISIKEIDLKDIEQKVNETFDANEITLGVPLELIKEQANQFGITAENIDEIGTAAESATDKTKELYKRIEEINKADSKVDAQFVTERIKERNDLLKDYLSELIKIGEQEKKNGSLTKEELSRREELLA